MYFGPRPVVYLTRPDTVKLLLASKSQIDKPYEYKLLDAWIGGGLLTSGGDTWRHSRRLLTPAFHSKVINGFVPLINKHAKIFCQVLMNNPSDVVDVANNCALDIVLESSMGFEEQVQVKGDTDYVKALIRYTILYMVRTTQPFMSNDFFYYTMTPSGRQAWHHLQTMRRHTQEIFDTRKKKIQLELQEKKERSKFEPLIDILLRTHLVDKELTEEQVIKQLETFTFAGFDTSALAISYSLFNLGHNPSIQDELYEEITNIVGSDVQSDIELEQLNRMVLLDAVVKETLRMFPSVPVIIRETNEDLVVNGYTVPKNTSVGITIYWLHNDKELWPNPEVFDPKRFLNKSSNEVDNFLPFSNGPRSCIGKQFAMNEVKIVVAHVVRNYRMVTVTRREDLKLAVDIVLKPKVKMLIQFESRHK